MINILFRLGFICCLSISAFCCANSDVRVREVERFILNDKPVDLVVLSDRIPLKVNVKNHKGFSTIYSEAHFKGVHFWIGSYRDSMDVVAITGLWAEKDGEVILLSRGDFGEFFYLNGSPVALINRSLNDHERLSVIFEVNISPNRDIALSELHLTYGDINSIRSTDDGLIFSGINARGEGFASVLNIDGGARVYSELQKEN